MNVYKTIYVYNTINVSKIVNAISILNVYYILKCLFVRNCVKRGFQFLPSVIAFLKCTVGDLYGIASVVQGVQVTLLCFFV